MSLCYYHRLAIRHIVAVKGEIVRRHITFILNGVEQQVSQISGDTTLLNWLRVNRKLTGSKEGCGEGDCGACTVVIARSNSTGLLWRPVNACILFMGMLEGASVTTIEGLSSSWALGDAASAGEIAGGEFADGLHPVQRAMVDFHGSQCGFCTPGFVMSLFAAWCNGTGLEAETIDDTLAGNLCRCTGYRPIVDAGMSLRKDTIPPYEIARRKQEAKMIAAIAHSETVILGDDRAKFVAPASGDDFSQFYADNPDATIVSGATDVGLWVTKQNRLLKTMLWTGRVDGFNAVKIEPARLCFAPAVTHQQGLEAIAGRWSEVAEVMRRFGSTQVRASGTICGNIANGSPIGDLPPMMIALGAEVELTKGTASRRLPLEDFYISYGQQDRQPGEFVSSLIVPATPHAMLRCYKLSKRFDQDISAVMGAFVISHVAQKITAARLAFGGMAGIPQRAKAVEAQLIGKPLTAASFVGAARALGDDFTPLSDMRGSAEYRLQAAANLILKYGLDICNGEQVRLAERGPSALLAAAKSAEIDE
ncbi:MAG: xanthine dehydrogenase small subunit [Bacteroidetes bacterium]|nr:xanthine dehydrogenase small subunit [Bacteroidota bacterium]